MVLDVADLPTASAGAHLTSLVDQGVKGKFVTSPWLAGGPFEITQGYGPTNLTYPEDHGTVHWHSGVDIGARTHTAVLLPAGVIGRAHYLDNPDGYGTALIIEVYTPQPTVKGVTGMPVRIADIYLGHLSTRLVRDGQVVRGGDHLAFTDCTGRCTGPHLHLEARPPDGRYGTDVDPSSWALSGSAVAPLPDLNPLDAVGSAITQAERDFVRTLTGLAQTGLGGAMMLTGLAVLGFGVRGMTPKQAARVTRRTAVRLNRRRVERRRPPRVARPATAAGRTRLRPTLQREVPAAPASTAPTLSSLPRARMSAAEYETSLGGISLQRQRALSAQGIRLLPGSRVRPAV